MLVASVTNIPRTKLYRGFCGGMGYIIMGGIMGGMGGPCGGTAPGGIAPWGITAGGINRGGIAAPPIPGGGGKGVENAPDGSIGGSELGGRDELMVPTIASWAPMYALETLGVPGGKQGRQKFPM